MITPTMLPVNFTESIFEQINSLIFEFYSEWFKPFGNILHNLEESVLIVLVSDFNKMKQMEIVSVI